jgi:DNA primase
MDDIVERIKEANRVEDVIGETFPLQKQHGKYLRCREHDSLVIDTTKQMYTWNSKSEGGDVIEWVMKRNGWDFKSACEWLARRAKMPEPKWGHEDHEVRLAARAREDAFVVAAGVFQRWLLADAEALEYVKGRGWSEETIRECMLGFSGRGTAAEHQEMRGELSMHGIEAECPNGAAILGYRGDMRAWGAKWKVTVQENWIEWGSISGMMGKTRLVYVHMAGGRVRTLSGRNILGAEVNAEGREVKSFNVPAALAGERQVYFNQVYQARSEECLVVEGQADAITLGQWGIPAVAMCGTSWQDQARLLEELRKRHRALYIGMDADEAGEKALVGKDGDWPLGKLLGPMARVIRWGEAS